MAMLFRDFEPYGIIFTNVGVVIIVTMVILFRDFEPYGVIFTTVKYLLLQIFPSFLKGNLLLIIQIRLNVTSEMELRRAKEKSRLTKLERRRAISQEVSRWPLIAEAREHARVNPYEICGGQSGTGTGFSQSSSVFPCQYHSTIAPHSFITIS
jgi:hypothetical protein